MPSAMCRAPSSADMIVWVTVSGSQNSPSTGEERSIRGMGVLLGSQGGAGPRSGPGPGGTFRTGPGAAVAIVGGGPRTPLEDV
ncbi:hypothetical protein GCM10017674_07350 [Streptomyces gardneri]|uniref:Uncharacterized protein n=1 Tax=Streptomyces gardneri TaxID=66892 RepID=A0A4Y3RUT9_9ACTN|nr:hypothetical protein SGA01_70810 [Streptomyces gardneri]GHG84109.1 hypothetical protein GCM10017674_07350 [Streptomyces gardneri]